MLRVISGSARGHRLKTPDSKATRPTADRVKESLFNIIAPHIESSNILDLYAGTGSLGIEALSRGAAAAVFVDSSDVNLKIIKYNLVHTRLEEKGRIIRGKLPDAVNLCGICSSKYDIVFMDPPYGKNFVIKTLNVILKSDIINKNGTIIIEREKDDKVPQKLGNIELVREKAYGGTVLSFYKYI